MDRVAILVDDLADARSGIGSLLARPAPPMLCVVVLCAPKLTHRIGPWAANRSRERWRDRWGASLRSKLEPMFEHSPVAQVIWTVARAPLQEVTRELQRAHGAGIEVLDARRPRTEPDDGAAQRGPGGRLSSLGALSASMSLLLALAD